MQRVGGYGGQRAFGVSAVRALKESDRGMFFPLCSFGIWIVVWFWDLGLWELDLNLDFRIPV